MKNAVLRKWDDLPEFMKIPEVKPYWEILNKKRTSLVLKRISDLLFSSVMLIILVLPMMIIGIIIKIDSRGPVFYRQERVTRYGRRFRIHKFRTMVENADKTGAAVTVLDDKRVTKLGTFLRKYRLDELPQLFDIIIGDMSFVGTRPEVVKYVEMYRPEMMATLLMAAGVTSEASIRYKDESKLLNHADDVNEVYMKEVVPAKMLWNLNSIKEFSCIEDALTIIRTVLAICGKEYR